MDINNSLTYWNVRLHSA